jgi:Zn-dependent peptidase ImmA (M78 family)
MNAEPNQIFALRLTQARKMRGWSLRELEAQLHGLVSHAALHKYERGQMLPGTDVLLPLASALKQTVDFFFRPPTVSLSQIEFRKRTALGVRQEAGLRENAADFFERYLEVEHLLGVDAAFQHPLEGVIIRKPEDIETAALKLRDVWELGLDALSNVVEMLENHQVKVYELEADDAFDGFSGWAGKIPVVVLNRKFPLVRKRLTALHELAHLLLAFPKGQFDRKQVEKLCHAFAGAMLMPEEIFRQRFGGRRSSLTVNELADIKADYGISIGAILARALQLGLVTEALYKTFCIEFRRRGWHKDEPGEYIGIERSNRFEQLLYRAVATDAVSMTKAANLAGQPLAAFRATLQIVP